MSHKVHKAGWADLGGGHSTQGFQFALLSFNYHYYFLSNKLLPTVHFASGHVLGTQRREMNQTQAYIQAPKELWP